MPNITYKTQIIEFEVLRKPRMKNTYIQVTAEGVLVKTNRTTSMREINGFVEKKSAWILKNLEKLKVRQKEKTLVSGSQIYYLGKQYPIDIEEYELLKRATLEFVDNRFVIKTQQGTTQEELYALIDMFYKQKAIEKITPLLKRWSEEMRLEPSYVGFRRAKTRWGSCSSRNRISFNYYLMKLPLSLVEYVVVHELAHITHKNHSADFWGLVGKYMEDYRERESKIKAFEKVI